MWSTLTKIFQWGPHWPKYFNEVHIEQNISILSTLDMVHIVAGPQWTWSTLYLVHIDFLLCGPHWCWSTLTKNRHICVLFSMLPTCILPCSRAYFQIIGYYTVRQKISDFLSQKVWKWFLKHFLSLISNLWSKIFFLFQFSKYSRFSRELGVFCGFFDIK